MTDKTNRMILTIFGSGQIVHGTEAYIDTTDESIEEYAPGRGLSEEMRKYYSDYLIDNAEPALVHDLFAQKQSIPAGSGKTIRFRKYDPLPKITTPIEEGVTPCGQRMNMSVIEATVAQYGGYVELTDLLIMTAIDNNLLMATKLLGSQAGRTLDTISREVLVGGTNVQYGEGRVDARYMLTGGSEVLDEDDYLTVNAIRRAVRQLKNQNAEKINGSYVAIIHPDCVYDLMNDPMWKFPHQYATPENIYEGEIGKIEGVRFIESSEAKIIEAPDLTPTSRSLRINNSQGYTEASTIAYDGGTSMPSGSLVGRYVIINGNLYYVGANTPTTMTLYTDSTKTQAAKISCTNKTAIYPGEAGAYGANVYATLIFGENAYGTTTLENGGLEHIVKQLGSGGSADPLNQRATVGWKATKVTTRLVEQFMIRIETTASLGFIGF